LGSDVLARGNEIGSGSELVRAPVVIGSSTGFKVARVANESALVLSIAGTTIGGPWLVRAAGMTSGDDPSAGTATV
jgi:hypothetical protein